MKLERISSPVEQYTALASLIRSLTLTVAIVSLEVGKALFGKQDSILNDFILKIQKQSDGLSHSILDYLVPLFRTYIDEKFYLVGLKRKIQRRIRQLLERCRV